MLKSDFENLKILVFDFDGTLADSVDIKTDEVNFYCRR